MSLSLISCFFCLFCLIFLNFTFEYIILLLLPHYFFCLYLQIIFPLFAFSIFFIAVVFPFSFRASMFCFEYFVGMKRIWICCWIILLLFSSPFLSSLPKINRGHCYRRYQNLTLPFANLIDCCFCS